MTERQDEEEACSAVAELEAELEHLADYVAELEAANKALRQLHAAAGQQLQGADMRQDAGLQLEDTEQQMAGEDRGDPYALRRLCQEQQAQQALADAQRQAEEAGTNSSRTGQRMALLEARLREAEAAMRTKVHGCTSASQAPIAAACVVMSGRVSQPTQCQ